MSNFLSECHLPLGTNLKYNWVKQSLRASFFEQGMPQICTSVDISEQHSLNAQTELTKTYQTSVHFYIQGAYFTVTPHNQ